MSGFNKFDYAMMQTAHIWAALSHATRKKVGCVFARDNVPIVVSYNGNPSFLDNRCEDDHGQTRPTVIHAENNGILFAAKHGLSLAGATCYVTCQPCSHCAGMLGVVGVTRVVYDEEYVSSSNGMDLKIFNRAGIEVLKLEKRLC